MSSKPEEFTILDETEELLVVNKPAGLLIHPSRPSDEQTLWHAVRDLLCFEIANGGQVSIINRLDRETSGIVLVAKTPDAARMAAMAMAAGQIRKEYLAMVWGWPSWETITIDQPIIRLGEVEESRIWLKRGIHPAGAVSITEVEVVHRAKRECDGSLYSIVRTKPITGRTHQIRVHLSHVGFPVVGDKIYGPSEEWYLRFIETGWTVEMQEALWQPHHALHSERLEVVWRNKELRWCAPPPWEREAHATIRRLR